MRNCRAPLLGHKSSHRLWRWLLTINKITPNLVGNSSSSTIVVDGAGFDSQTEVFIIKNNEILPVIENTTLVSEFKMIVQIDLTKIAAGECSIRIQKGDTFEETKLDVLAGG